MTEPTTQGTTGAGAVPGDRPAPGVQVVFDCRDPHATAAFWAAVLGYVVEDVDELVRRMLAEGHASDADVLEQGGRMVWRDASAASDPAGARPRLYFQRVPEEKAVKNRVHLDVHVAAGAVEAEVARLRSLGARRLYDGRQGPYTWVTMADLEGNEFCVA